MTVLIERLAPSRRQILGDVALFGGGAALLAAIASPQSAAAKVSPSDVGYQTTPKGGSRCSNCVNFQGPDACKVVSGKVSPNGWCSVYAKKV